MKLDVKKHSFWLVFTLGLFAGSLLKAGEYEHLFGRSLAQRRGETHARMTADLVILGRSGVDSNDLLFEDATLANSLLNANALEFEKLPTGRYDIILTDDTPYELQFTFFGFPDAREARARRTATDIRSLVFGTIDAPGPFSDPDAPTDTWGVVYLSKLGSIEANLRRRLSPQVTLLHGFRFVGLQEDLNFVSNETFNGNTLTTTGDFIDVDNALYGYQLGLESTVWSHGRTRLVFEGRGGVFVNHMEINYGATFSGTGPGGADEEKVLDIDSDRAVFVGDIRATLIVPLGGGSLRLGYQLLSISRAALAPDQLDDFDIFAETGAFDLGSPIYQGGFIGLEVPF